MKPLELFFGEIDGRLTSLVDELARSVDGDPGKVVREVTSKGRARCLSMFPELAAEAEDRVRDLVRARVAEAEQDFLRASQILKGQ